MGEPNQKKPRKGSAAFLRREKKRITELQKQAVGEGRHP